MRLKGYLAKFGLSKPQHMKRFASYVKELSKDDDRVLFDDKVLAVLKRYAHDPKFVEEVRCQLNEIGYAQSRKEAHQLDEQIDRFCQSHVKSAIHLPNYAEALEEVKKEFSNLQLSPLSYKSDSDMIEALPKKATHAGSMFLETGLRTKVENMDDILNRFNAEVSKAKKSKSFNKLTILGVRTQNSSPYKDSGELKEQEELPKRSKTRMVSMVHLMIIMAERMFQKPLQDEVLKYKSWYAGGKTPSELRREVHFIQRNFDKWISLDYSKFDQSIPGWLIRDAFTILRSSFKNVDDELWEVMVHDFVNKTFVNTKGELKTAHDGVPSGSMFTQIIDSVCNRIMIVTYMKSRGITSYKMVIMGDDNVIGYKGYIDMQDLSKYLMNVFGVEVNAQKSTKGTKFDSISFLSREWRGQGEWRQPKTLCTKLMYPERFRDYNDESTPEDVIFSYILSYPLGMAELIDTKQFFRDYRPTGNNRFERGEKNLEGYLKYQKVYNGTVIDWLAEERLVKLSSAS